MPSSRGTHSSFKCLFHPGGTANGCARCASLPTVVPATPRGVHTALRKAKKAVQRRWVSVTNSAPLRLLLLLLATSALLFGVLALVGEPPRAQDTAHGTQRSLRRAAQERVLAAKAALVAAFGHLSQRGSLSNSTHPGPGLRIPRTIHQTVPYGKPGGRAAALRASWERQNPGWRVRLYTDTHAAAFIAAEFPEYLEAYYALPKPAGRADLFRVLVLLRRGGVYADADAGCVRPLDELLRYGDTLVMGWENTFDAPQQALDRHYVRQRQVRV
jgi:Glycosyltransferase sugar-binding region containing DXD motif